MWIQTRVTVRKWLSWVLTSVTLTFDFWPWPFAWTSLLSLVITSENFMMIWWWEHDEKGVTDRRTDRRTDWTGYKAAWSQLKKSIMGIHHEIPWLFPDFPISIVFPWLFTEFPDFSLTLKNIFFPDFSLTAGNPDSTCSDHVIITHEFCWIWQWSGITKFVSGKTRIRPQVKCFASCWER